MDEQFPVYHEQVPDLAEQMTAGRNLGLLVIDASPFAQIEENYGLSAYQSVRQRLFKLLAEQRGKDFRDKDLVTLDEPRGLRFVLFMDRRRKDLPIVPDSLRTLRARLAGSLLPKLARTAMPFLSTPPRIDIGHGIAIRNPLVHPHRIISRAFQQALKNGALERRIEDSRVVERLQEILLCERVTTVYQPIVRISDRSVLGFEALSRGAPGTGLMSADLLFGAAAEHHLLIELDRLCRKKAFHCSERLPKEARVFVNTLPATIRDPEFKGKHLIDSLTRADLTPDRIVIEITEKLVIENYSLFQDAMSYFTEIGMSMAVDDVGAGYSGLETIARLRPAYLKVDTGLVRDIHNSTVNREMMKAIISMGKGIGAKVIAEGIENGEDLGDLQEMGVEYGQGYFLGRPEF